MSAPGCELGSALHALPKLCEQTLLLLSTLSCIMTSLLNEAEHVHDLDIHLKIDHRLVLILPLVINLSSHLTYSLYVVPLQPFIN